MRTIEFKVSRQKLTDISSDRSPIRAGSKGYLRASFVFTSDWDGMTKAVSFFDKYDNEHAYILHDNVINVPDDVTDGSLFRIQVTGKDGNVLIKTNKLAILQKGA